jgi:dTDP-4-dehydrorhamnose 3,5-epimerase
MIEVNPTSLPGVLMLEPRILRDSRGYFLEAFVAPRLRPAGIACEFVQDNLSFSAEGVLRGVHFQLGSDGNPGQAKLVRAVTGRILDVAVDLRRGSASFGKCFGTELSASNGRALFIPAGFGHGFYALEPSHVLYKCSDIYRPELERGIAWNDPELAIAWPSRTPLLSPRDASLPGLAELADTDLPADASDAKSCTPEEVVS